MDKLQAIRVFKSVVETGGFAAAARALNSSPPSVSRLISELESDLGVRLFQRSTRKVGLTEEGEIFLLRGVALLDELDTVSDELRQRQHHPRGRLRISSVVAFGQERIAPVVPGFLAKYPGVEVDLEISNRTVDLVQEHFDLAIRIGGDDGLVSSGLKARKIFSQKLMFVATPGYIEIHGDPADIDDLANHRLVKQISGNWGRVNTLSHAGETFEFTLPDAFVVNSPNAARNAILSGRVIGLIADYLVEDMLTDGRLVRVLPDYETMPQSIFAVFVHRSYMPAKVRSFIEHLSENLRQTTE
ncbi:transcriptional regulator, LysR family [Shimia gijangensis]|uniref:Transcriptional regulator, LysR family n=2 Tax=Shimia gijangensis TaxID=1470563 RepID=A0A1M6FIN2_9RHOB|nr:transcriptional regulator, LysR family [Shimia gijangensis]